MAIMQRHVADGFADLCLQLAAAVPEGAAPASPGFRVARLLRDCHHVLLPIVGSTLGQALREELARLAPQP
ncbi:MAG TPA: hypothetical protein VF774_05500, partial [Pseudoduganella sp.]